MLPWAETSITVAGLARVFRRTWISSRRPPRMLVGPHADCRRGILRPTPYRVLSKGFRAGYHLPRMDDPPSAPKPQPPRRRERNVFQAWPTCTVCTRRMTFLGDTPEAFRFTCDWCDRRTTVPRFEDVPSTP
jgi:hypothetical protein